VAGFLLEAGHAAVVVHFQHAEAARVAQRHLDRAHRQHRTPRDVDVEHLAVVHLVDVVAGQDDHPARALLGDGVEVLVHGVRGAEVPVLSHPLLRGQDVHELPSSVLTMLQPMRTWRLRLWALYWVAMKILRSPEFTQFDR
jgi:hypothetical protein